MPGVSESFFHAIPSGHTPPGPGGSTATAFSTKPGDTTYAFGADVAGSSDGVRGTGKATGVTGIATGAELGVGVKGTADDTGGIGVSGTGSVYGVVGQTAAKYGAGVRGTSDHPEGYGVEGGGYLGVLGFVDRDSGVGVYGTTDSNAKYTVGVVGIGHYGGVQGLGDVGVSGGARTPDGYGVIGSSYLSDTSSGYAGFFQGNVHVDGNFIVAGGAKSAVVPFPDGSHRQLYCMESPESWFEDFGFGQLRDGQAQVELDADFATTVNTDTYHVFITEYDDHNALYVTERTSTGFRVQAKSPQSGAGEFSYRIVAKRKDVPGRRLESVTMRVPRMRRGVVCR